MRGRRVPISAKPGPELEEEAPFPIHCAVPRGEGPGKGGQLLRAEKDGPWGERG